jgi:hypothetical protein
VRALRGTQYKLVESSIDGSEMLFDVPADLGEVHNLLPHRRELARRLRAAATDRRDPRRSRRRGDHTDDATRAQLRALATSTELGIVGLSVNP